MRYLYEDVKKGVKEQIKGLSHGDRLPSERKLSEVYKVDRITVRKALLVLEKEGYIIKKRGAGTFVNDINVDEENKVSLLLPTFSTVEHNSIYKGIRKYIADKDIAIELFDCSLNKRQEDAYLEYLERCKVNKIIVYPFFKDSVTKSYAEKLSRIAKAGKKLVVLDQFVPGVDADFVVFDKFRICYSMFEYLLGKGNRDILFINSQNDSTGQVLKRAYDKFCYDYGLDKNSDLYAELPIKISTERAKKTVLDILDRNIYFSGVVSLHMSFANGIMQALKERNMEDKDMIFVYHKGYSFEIKKPYIMENSEKIGIKAMEVLFDTKTEEPGTSRPRIHYVESKFVN